MCKLERGPSVQSLDYRYMRTELGPIPRQKRGGEESRCKFVYGHWESEGLGQRRGRMKGGVGCADPFTRLLTKRKPSAANRNPHTTADTETQNRHVRHTHLLGEDHREKVSLRWLERSSVTTRPSQRGHPLRISPPPAVWRPLRTQDDTRYRHV